MIVKSHLFHGYGNLAIAFIRQFLYLSRMKHFIFLCAVIMLAACGPCRPSQPERLPDDEVPAFRTAAVKMAPYIVLEDSAYHLTISKEDASGIGVPGKYYDRMRQELEYTNYLVREEYNKKGIPIEMPDFRIDTVH